MYRALYGPRVFALGALFFCEMFMALDADGFDSVEACIAAIGRGEMIIITDDANRENEGDLVLAADFVTPEAVNFMVRNARGLLCTPCDGAVLDRMGLEVAPSLNRGDAFATAFTFSIDGAAHTGVTTGISAGDRASTIRTLVDAKSSPRDIVSPGHTFPLRARAGGVLVRSGHTEAAVDFARLAGCSPAGVICEIMKEDGSMARLPDLQILAKSWGLRMCSIEKLIHYRKQHEKLVEEVESVDLPTAFGHFQLTMFRSKLDGFEHLALTQGDVAGGDPPLVRVHSECFTGDVFGSSRCDCGWQLHSAMEQISAEGRGVLLYMRQEGRGIGLANKLHAYKLQEQGFDTVEANVKLGFAPDLREYGIGAQILEALGIRKLRLLTNNPDKILGLAGYDLEITERVPIVAHAGRYNQAYLETKKSRMGHLL